MLISIDGVLSKDLVGQFRETLRQARWLDGKRTAGTQASSVKVNQQLDNQSKPAAGLRQQLLTLLGQHQLFLSAALPHKILPPTFSATVRGIAMGRIETTRSCRRAAPTGCCGPTCRLRYF